MSEHAAGGEFLPYGVPACREAWDSVDHVLADWAHERPDLDFTPVGVVTRLARVRGYLDAVAAAAAEPVIEKYTGVLAAADVFTASTTFHVMQSLRLDKGYGSQVHP